MQNVSVALVKARRQGMEMITDPEVKISNKDFNIPSRVREILKATFGDITITALAEKSEIELCKIKNIGYAARRDIQTALKEHGLSLQHELSLMPKPVRRKLLAMLKT